MILLIIALTMSTTMGFYALYLAEKENTGRINRKNHQTAGFAAL